MLCLDCFFCYIVICLEVYTFQIFSINTDFHREKASSTIKYVIYLLLIPQAIFSSLMRRASWILIMSFKFTSYIIYYSYLIKTNILWLTPPIKYSSDDLILQFVFFV